MGFWPYLRHAHTSDDEPSAGTWQTTFFTWFFLECAETELAACKKSELSTSRKTKQFKEPPPCRGLEQRSVPSLGSWHATGHLPPARLRPRRSGARLW
jgi:hypothetical protein